MTFEKFEEFLMSSECYWEHDVSYIDKDGLQHLIAPQEFWEYQTTIARLIAEEEVTIKVEQMQRYWKWDDRTIHVFYNPAGGPTFDTHTDPVDVIIECKDGVKHMEVDGKEIALQPGHKLLITAGQPHKALNYEKALMASHGIGDTETLNRIRENNRNVQS